jgi:hypothetical protein
MVARLATMRFSLCVTVARVSDPGIMQRIEESSLFSEIWGNLLSVKNLKKNVNYLFFRCIFCRSCGLFLQFLHRGEEDDFLD